VVVLDTVSLVVRSDREWFTIKTQTTNTASEAAWVIRLTGRLQYLPKHPIYTDKRMQRAATFNRQRCNHTCADLYAAVRAHSTLHNRPAESKHLRETRPTFFRCLTYDDLDHWPDFCDIWQIDFDFPALFASQEPQADRKWTEGRTSKNGDSFAAKKSFTSHFQVPFPDHVMLEYLTFPASAQN